MIAAVFRVMLLGLWRDRGALALAFVLPSVVFAIFASIFSNTTQGDLHLRVAMVNDNQDTAMATFVQSLSESGDLSAELLADADADVLRQRIRDGDFDTGLIVRAGEPQTNFDEPLFTIVAEPSRELAALSLRALVSEQLAQTLPHLLTERSARQVEALVGEYSEVQQTRLTRALAEMADPSAEQDADSGTQQNLIAMEPVYGAQENIRGQSGVAYYAGATAILFLLFSAVNAGMVVLQERSNGIDERLLLGFGARLLQLAGRFGFLVALGFLQVSAIFAVARFGFALPVEQALAQLAMIALAAAMASAGLALLILVLCRTSQQAQTFSSFFILIVSAVGGSMVPRFMMPPWLQQLSWFTPNAWAIEGFYGALVRDQGWVEVALPFGVLMAFGLVCLALAAVPWRR